MLKNRRVIREIGNKINETSQKIADDLISSNIDFRGLEGREEDITSQLKEKLTTHLLQDIEKSFKLTSLKGVSFDAYTYRKKDESKIGADIAGFVKITIMSKTGIKSTAKAYLAQAKIAARRRTFPYNHLYYKSKNDGNILKQAKNMLNITSDSFFLLYTVDGIFMIPSFDVVLFNKDYIDTRYCFKKKFGRFYEEFFECYIGDHQISQIYDKPKDLISFAKEFNVKNILYISAKMEQNEEDNYFHNEKQ